MPRINLLPWRAEQRKKRQQEFVAAVLGAALVGVVVVVVGIQIINGMINSQRERNDLLRAEIAELDKKIEEINGLEAQKERLLARMEIIEQLQRSRPEVVRLMDQLARTVPEGVYLKTFKQTGADLQITGTAQSSTRVSTYMRQIDASGAMTNPQLDVVKTEGEGRTRHAEFTVKATQLTANADEQDETAGGGR